MKHVLMVGASRGLGRVTNELFKKNGIHTTVLSRHPIAGSNAGFKNIDLSDPTVVRSRIRDIFNEIGVISGACFFQRWRNGTNAESDNNELNVSLNSTRVIIEESMNFLDDQKDHAFTFVSSVNSSFVSLPAGIDYHIAKAGLDIAARYCAVQYGHLAARFNTVNPGSFSKPENVENLVKFNKLVNKISNLSPLGRATTANDVAELILFLSSQRSLAITGQNITIDSGVSLQWPES